MMLENADDIVSPPKADFCSLKRTRQPSGTAFGTAWRKATVLVQSITLVPDGPIGIIAFAAGRLA
jgi:hypothetical protein